MQSGFRSHWFGSTPAAAAYTGDNENDNGMNGGEMRQEAAAQHDEIYDDFMRAHGVRHRGVQPYVVLVMRAQQRHERAVLVELPW